MADLASSKYEDFFISKKQLSEYDDECCSPYFLTDRMAVAVLSVCRYLEWESRWEDRDIDRDLVTRLEDELLTCREDVVTQLKRIADALYTSEETPRGIADLLAETTANGQDNTPFLDVAEDIATVLGVDAGNLPEVALEIIPLVLAAA